MFQKYNIKIKLNKIKLNMMPSVYSTKCYLKHVTRLVLNTFNCFRIKIPYKIVMKIIKILQFL